MASFALTNSLVLFSFVSSWPSSLFMAEELPLPPGLPGLPRLALSLGGIPGHPIKMMYYHSTAQRRSSIAKWVDYVFR